MAVARRWKHHIEQLDDHSESFALADCLFLHWKHDDRLPKAVLLDREITDQLYYLSLYAEGQSWPQISTASFPVMHSLVLRCPVLTTRTAYAIVLFLASTSMPRLKYLTLRCIQKDDKANVSGLRLVASIVANCHNLCLETLIVEGPFVDRQQDLAMLVPYRRLAKNLELIGILSPGSLSVMRKLFPGTRVSWTCPPQLLRATELDPRAWKFVDDQGRCFLEAGFGNMHFCRDHSYRLRASNDNTRSITMDWSNDRGILAWLLSFPNLTHVRCAGDLVRNNPVLRTHLQRNRYKDRCRRQQMLIPVVLASVRATSGHPLRHYIETKANPVLPIIARFCGMAPVSIAHLCTSKWARKLAQSLSTTSPTSCTSGSKVREC